MPTRLFSREHVERELKQRRCRHIKDYRTSTAWETASGVWFSVPFETPEQRTSEATLQEILRKVETMNFFTGTKRPEKGQ
jgi:hypothetical protein